MNTDIKLPSLTVSAISIETWDMAFAKHLQTLRLASRSQSLAIQHLRVFAEWHAETFHEAFDPRNVTNYDLMLYRKQSLEQQKVKARTWNSRHWALSIFCAWLKRPQLMDGIEQKATGRASTKHRSLTDDEYHRLIHALERNADPQRIVTPFEYLDNTRTRAAICLMLSGLRVEETSLLELDDITLKARSGEVVVRSGKGDKERTVYPNDITRKALASYLSFRPASASNNLFLRSIRSLERDVAELGAQIGVPDLTPHWLRYTCAKRLERAGETIETIRDVLGHATIEQTRKYLRSSAEDLQSAMERIM